MSESTEKRINNYLSASKRHQAKSDPDSDKDDDDLFAELEAELEDDNAYAREHGLEQLKREMERVKQLKDSGHGLYMEIEDEKQVIRISASEPRCVIHFFHRDFRRCQIMDKHLAKLAPKYFDTRFIRVFVENVPWLVERLSIKVLPCVICFVNGVSKDKMVGFEDLGNEDEFQTATLELRLLQNGMIRKPSATPQTYTTASTSTRQEIRGRQDDDFDFDLDD